MTPLDFYARKVYTLSKMKKTTIGKDFTGFMVSGTYADCYLRYVEETTCDNRCMNARGPDCECSCGGMNHGEKHSI